MNESIRCKTKQKTGIKVGKTHKKFSFFLVFGNIFLVWIMKRKDFKKEQKCGFFLFDFLFKFFAYLSNYLILLSII